MVEFHQQTGEVQTRLVQLRPQVNGLKIRIDRLFQIRLRLRFVVTVACLLRR